MDSPVSGHRILEVVLCGGEHLDVEGRQLVLLSDPRVEDPIAGLECEISHDFVAGIDGWGRGREFEAVVDLEFMGDVASDSGCGHHR